MLNQAWLNISVPFQCYSASLNDDSFCIAIVGLAVTTYLSMSASTFALKTGSCMCRMKLRYCLLHRSKWSCSWKGSWVPSSSWFMECGNSSWTSSLGALDVSRSFTHLQSQKRSILGWIYSMSGNPSFLVNFAYFSMERKSLLTLEVPTRQPRRHWLSPSLSCAKDPDPWRELPMKWIDSLLYFRRLEK